ncbi:recombination regulator RecX [Ottowia sp.]|uniref:recombination regulator RecX n=1 Tax=Ottowia sp. TaxID=1898956 RepID=UPI002CC10757|nr:recombination regulator RecX [Ottowia sp.]HRN77310.1 recombination regulator RecX [Ottowia sp.]HRQ03756.1 recombination regulator RecX [Ottowia sp.]
MIPSRPPSLKARALRLLAQREHSRVELERKLAPYLPEDAPDPAAALARVLDELVSKGFISEARVAESLIHRRAGRLGTSRVLQELRGKGLDEDLLADAASRLRATEFERAREVWCKKFGAPAEDAAGRAKQMRFLAARGFEAEVVRRVLRDADVSPEE